jgi:hypothetical protein
LAESSIQKLKERLTKLLHQHDLATQKSQMLEAQLERDTQREQMLTDLTHQLMDRQRELNVMLNRANIMLNRAQEANTILSLEFTELCHALPAPEDPDVKDRIQRINDLFKNTGVSDAEVTMQPEAQHESVIVTPPPVEPMQTTDAPFVVIEETAAEVAGNGADPSAPGEARVNDLFRRTGDEENIPTAAPAPAYDATPEPPKPDFASEPMPEYQPPFHTERDYSIPEMPEEPEPQPVGAASTEQSETISGRRWWQMLGRR